MNPESNPEEPESKLVGGSDVQAYDKEEPLNLYGGNDDEVNKTVGGSKKQNHKRKTVRRARQKKRQLRKKTQKRQQKRQQKKSQSRKNKKGGKGKGYGLETAAVPLAIFATQQYIARRLGKTKKSRRVTRKR